MCKWLIIREMEGNIKIVIEGGISEGEKMLIDKQGRLFGRWSIVDVLVILFYCWGLDFINYFLYEIKIVFLYAEMIFYNSVFLLKLIV